MQKYREGDWYVFKEKTQKPFERFRTDATRGLMGSLSGLVTTHEWRGKECHIRTPGTRSLLAFENGEIVCKLKISRWIMGYMRAKILSDVEATTREVAGLVSSENRDVFIVHGHDEQARNELKKFLSDMGLNPIVLFEQDDRGMTIIDKFEYYASSCCFAFILMTPDDPRQHKDAIETQWHARQNVIMELGWFMAKLGRERVVLLYKQRLEIPSDIHGVVYIEFEESVLEASDRLRQRLRGAGLIG